jgi:putative ABC transport system substrate-binding protein
VKRREFITLLGGAAVAWPAIADAQQPERMRRIGIMMNSAADDPEPQVHLAALRQGLQQLGWIEGRNVDGAEAVLKDTDDMHRKSSRLRPM